MNPTNTLVPEGIGHGPDLSKLSASERTKHHTKQMQAIGFRQGVEGVAAYRKENPDAGPVLVNIQSIAYTVKPKGYNDYLVKLAETWLTSDTAATATNIADVHGLNAHFSTDRFNPANHFSKPLSPGRLEKLRAVFASHGVPLDTSKATTLSKVKATAKAARGRCAGRPFGSVGSIVDNTLVIGGHRFAIMDHHGHEAVKLQVAGKRIWLRLDVLAAAYGLLSGGVLGGDDPLSTIALCNIGELVPELENPDFDPLVDSEKGELVPVSSPSLIGELVPISDPSSLTSRLAALREWRDQRSHSTTCPDGVDPLNI